MEIILITDINSAIKYTNTMLFHMSCWPEKKAIKINFKTFKIPTLE